jgi:Spy/CpxP family protein refolding chaperone
MRRTLLTVGIFACTLFSTTSILRAQTNNAPAQDPERPHKLLAPTGLAASQPNIAGVAIGGPVGVLTDQQRASYETIMSAMRGRILELDSRLHAARQDLLNTSVGTKFDEKLVREKALAAARIEAELTVLRIKAYSEVQPPLSPEQIAKVKAGEPGPMRRLQRRGLPGESPGTTNQDANGLPPKQ